MKYLILITLFAVSSWNSATSCLMLPRGYAGTIGQKTHEAIVIHAAGREELILRINYQVTPKEKGKMPPYFAWVITVPNKPDKYSLADEKIFRKVFDWGNPKVPQRMPVLSLGIPPGEARNSIKKIEVSPVVKVGPYKIQPIRALGEHALEGLNDWLNSNGFPAEDPEHMRYFVKNNFTFLCVKISADDVKKSVPRGGKLKPLQLSFATENPYYPLRFSSRQGVFGINVWLLTQGKIDHKASAPVYRQLGLKPLPIPVAAGGEVNAYPAYNVSVKPMNFPKELRKVISNSPSMRIKKNFTWHLSVLRHSAVNSQRKIAHWKQDIFVPLEKK